MFSILLALLACLPLGLAFFLIATRGRKQAMPVVCVAVAILSLVVWRVSPLQAAASLVQGLVLSLDVVLILFSAIFLTHVLRESRVMAFIRTGFSHIHPDRRVQAILIAWFFGSGVESLFGFSAASATCSVMLTGIGFPPACAVIMGVMGPMVANAFGAAGLPVVLGIAEGLNQPEFLSQLAAQDLSQREFLRAVSAQIAMFHGIAGTFVPLMMAMMMTYFFGKSKSWKESLSLAPFALFCGLIFTVPYTLTAIFVGPEFPSLVGALVGMALMLTALGTGVLFPKEKWDFPPKKDWEIKWSGGKSKYGYVYQPEVPEPMSPWKAWLPYGLLAFLIVATRLPLLPWTQFLQEQAWAWPQLFGSSVNIVLRPFSFSTVALLIVVGVSIFIFKTPTERLRGAFGYWTITVTWFAMMTAPFTMMIACLYNQSGVNGWHWPSMAQAIAQGLAQIPYGEYWAPFIAPFIGAAGSFLTSNNIFSNVMLSAFQHEWGQSLVMPEVLFPALQAVGASVGTMFTLHYLAGGAVVGMLGSLGSLARKTMIPALVYLSIIGTIGVLAAHGRQITHFLF
ncbi:MAG: L-lactate permease [Verrucomicrobiota bacterium]